MKPRITINGIVLLLLFLIFNSVNAQPIAAIDGGFENWTLGIPSGLGTWTFSGTVTESGTLDAHGGSYALALPAAADFPALVTDYLAQSIVIPEAVPGPGTSVTIWAKGAGIELLNVGLFDGVTPVIFDVGGSQAVGAVWTMHTFTFTTVAPGPHELRIATDAPTVIIDDVVVVQVGPSTLGPILNGDFETWTTTPTTLNSWSLNTFTSADVTQSVTFHGGAFAASIVAGDLTSGTGSYLYQSLGTASGNVVVDVDFWAQSAGPNGIQVGISNGTSLVFSDEFALTGAYVNYSFSFNATSGTTYEIRFAGGVGTTVLLDDLNVAENDAPTATALFITGTYETGYTLTANYTYGDTEVDLEGATTFQWYTATTSTGTVGKTAISGATASTYKLKAAQNGFHIGFDVTPKALTGTSPGATAGIGTYGGPVVPNVAPVCGPIVVSQISGGTPVKQDETYNAAFTITDADGNLVDYTYQWYKSDDASGTNKTACTGTTNSGVGGGFAASPSVIAALGATYALDFTDVGKWITVEITPIADFGVSPGTIVSSTAFGPVTGYVLEIPLQLAPLDGATAVVLSPTFTWALVLGLAPPFTFPPTDFEVEVATDAFFSNIVHSETLAYHISQTTGTIATILAKNTKHYWRVRSILTSTTPDTYSPWSAIWTFTTTAVAKPIISYPTGGATVYTKTPTVYWYTGVINTGVTFTVNVYTGSGGPHFGASPYASGNGGTDTYLQLPALIPGNTYWIEVVATDGFTTETSNEESFTVSISAGGLVVPTPSYPIGGVTVYSNTPSLYWYLSPYSTGLTYYVEVSDDGTFAGGDIVYTAGPLLNLYTTVSPALTSGATYWWRVRSDNGAPSAFSTPETFTVVGSTAGTIPLPILSWPIGGALVYTTSPTLYWYLSSYATGLTYEWEVYDDAGYTSLVTSGTSSTLSAVATGLMEGTTYYWQVRTEQGGFFSAWVQDSFATYTSFGGGGGVPVPYLSSPIGGGPSFSTSPTLYWYIIGSTVGITYEVKLSKYPGLVPLEAGYPVIGLTSSSYALSGLADGTTYWWSVRSFNGVTYSAWATAQSFYTPVPASLTATPNPGSPIGGVIPESSSPELSWFVMGDGSQLKYILEYAKNSNFVDSKQVNDIEASSVVISNLDAGETYFWRVASKSPDGSVSDYSPIVSFTAPDVTGVDDLNIIPEKFDVAQNYPNPFNPTTTIRYSLPEATFVTIRVYDMLGQEVKTLINKETNAGVYNVSWNGTDNLNNKVSTGTYIYRVVAGTNIITKKMVLLK